MDEYISKKALLKAVEEDFNKDWGERGTNGDWDYIDGARDEYDDVIDIICQMPAADVQPIRHGRWIEKPPYKDETVKGLEFQIVCSECDEQNCSLEFDENYNAIGKTFYRTRYCPNCGARMDGETE